MAAHDFDEIEDQDVVDVGQGELIECSCGFHGVFPFLVDRRVEIEEFAILIDDYDVEVF